MKYTPDGGTIAFGVEARGARVIVSMTDTGCGIARADLPHIFERFYRGRPQETSENTPDNECLAPNETTGTGLGLYLTKNLVEQIEGEIRAESPVGGSVAGTRFFVILPTNN